MCMATKVFISWSGELSRKLGEALRNWLPSTLQFVRPYFTPDDIEKGAKWSSEITKELGTSNIGIVCLTADNTEKPWILFEAGALSKSIDSSHVCTLLFGLEPAEVKGPLTSFQATRFIKADFKKLILTINNSAGDARLDPAVLETVFEMWWPKLDEQVTEILRSHDNGVKEDKRSDRDMLEELLELMRLNTSRPSRSRVPPEALMELMDSLDEISFLLARDHGEMGMHTIHRLERPLRHLCMEAGMPELFERIRMSKKRREFNDANNGKRAIDLDIPVSVPRT